MLSIKRKSLYVLMGFMVFLSCGKEDDLPVIPTEPAPDDNLMIWQIPLGLDSAEYGGRYTTIIDDGILYSTSSIEKLEDETIRLVSATDGSPLWEWSEYINPVLGQSVSDFRLFDNTLIVCSAQDNYGIDLRSGNTKSATLTEKGLPFIS